MRSRIGLLSYWLTQSLCVIVTCILLTGCGSEILWNNIFRYDGVFSGMVLDNNDKTPISGFVVMTVWYHGTVGGSRYYDTAETVTNDHGEFTLPGQGFVFSMNERRVYLFKAGYESVDGNFYDMLAEQLPNYRLQDNKALFLMKKLTPDERKKARQPDAPDSQAPFNKAKLMLMELKKDDIERGLERSYLWDGHHY